MSCYLFNGPFKLIPTHKIPFLDIRSLSVLRLALEEYFKWFMSYYNAIQTYIIFIHFVLLYFKLSLTLCNSNKKEKA